MAHPKPAPDLFLHAASSLGFAPEQTVVVEDSTRGVKAAIAAGMRVTSAFHAIRSVTGARRAGTGCGSSARAEVRLSFVTGAAIAAALPSRPPSPLRLQMIRKPHKLLQRLGRLRVEHDRPTAGGRQDRRRAAAAERAAARPLHRGAQARALLAEIRSSIKQLQEAAQSAAASEQPGLKLIADQLALAADAYDRAIQYLLDQAKENIRAVYAGSVPYLMLTGYVLGGWQLARAALVCADPQPNGIDEKFAEDKFATAVFYAGAILPRVQALSAAMLQGAIIDDVLSRSALQH